MAVNPDDIFEKIVMGLSPIWGPFYAVFYILRLMWVELFRRDREEE
jgi:hypothetical protein